MTQVKESKRWKSKQNVEQTPDELELQGAGGSKYFISPEWMFHDVQ